MEALNERPGTANGVATNGEGMGRDNASNFRNIVEPRARVELATCRLRISNSLSKLLILNWLKIGPIRAYPGLSGSPVCTVTCTVSGNGRDPPLFSNSSFFFR